jgi:8-oxo-dGTP diphosphatase
MASAVLEHQREGLREILIVKLRTEPHVGQWTFPFGPTEPGETPEPAMRRILRDQLGLLANIHYGQPPFDHPFGEQTYRWRFLFGETNEIRTENCHYQEVRWVPIQSLREYEFEPVSRQVVDWLLEE